MKIKLFLTVLSSALAGSATAQSAFQGFYGQIATGYESNSMGSGSGVIDAPNSSESYPINSPSQQFGGAPLVFGLGYNLSVAPKWLIGVGVDYSALSQTSSAFPVSLDTSSYPGTTANLTGSSVQISNRFNIFITPGYEIDVDKLVYLKAGYSSVSAKFNSPTNYNASTPGYTLSTTSDMSSPTSAVGGYIIGIGYKQIIASGVYGFAEANYMGYSKPSFSNSGTIAGVLPTSSNLSASLNTYQLLVGVGYKF